MTSGVPLTFLQRSHPRPLAARHLEVVRATAQQEAPEEHRANSGKQASSSSGNSSNRSSQRSDSQRGKGQQQRAGRGRGGGRGGGRGNSKQQQKAGRGGPAAPVVLDPPDHKCGYVTIVGKPNAGKSTLQNALVGQKLSIVTRKAQTTRHKVLGIDSGDGHQLVLLDTPGVIENITNKLDARMMEAVRTSVEAADAVLVIIDASHRPEDDMVLAQPGPGYKGPPMAVVLNKVDLLEPADRDHLIALCKEQCPVVEAVLPCSALNNKGIDAIKAWAVEHLPLGPALYDKDFVSEHPERFFVSEIVREQVFLQYRMEIPYACTVLCTDFKERTPPAKDYVQVIVYVERDSQRGIVLGQAGSALKKLATASRAGIEAFVGRPVYLDLSVKVRENWRKDDKSLEALGY